MDLTWNLIQTKKNFFKHLRANQGNVNTDDWTLSENNSLDMVMVL